MSKEPLEPDAWDLYHASHVTLLPCPLCGREAGPPMSYINTSGGFPGEPPRVMYQTLIGCSDVFCAQIRWNERTREAAREGAVRKWQTRKAR